MAPGLLLSRSQRKKKKTPLTLSTTFSINPTTPLFPVPIESLTLVIRGEHLIHNLNEILVILQKCLRWTHVQPGRILKARGVTESINDIRLLANFRVAHGIELGQILLDRVRPAHFPLINEFSDSCGCVYLRAGAYHVKAVRVRLEPLVDISVSKTLQLKR